ncbi:MAG: LysR family transcriptional regulator [Deltaproteobacteria bacterium]|nr:LysR family transcriptional regulator [Deltaproteobacteria bacterium]
MDLDLDLLRVLVAVADGGSLAAAARTLTCSRATVRRRLAELEERAGTPLLRRADEGLVPTDAGQAVARQGRQMLAEASALLAQARTIGAEPHGSLRVAAFPGLAPFGVGMFLRLVRGRWPHLQLDLFISEQPHEELLGRADIALSFDRRAPPGPWRAIDVAHPREWLVASPAYLQQRGHPDTIDDLAGHDLLLWRPPDGPCDSLPTPDGGRVTVSPVLISSDVFLLRQMAQAGFGIAYLPDGELDDPTEPPGSLRPVLEHHIGTRRPFRVLVPRALDDTPRVRAIVTTLEGILAVRRQPPPNPT